MPRHMNLSALLLDRHLTDGGSRPAIRGPHGLWRLADLARRTGEMASGLREAGVGRGDVVAVTLPDGAEWPAVVLGAARLGAVSALVSPTTPPDRVGAALRRAGPRVVVGTQVMALPATPHLSPALLARLGAGRPDPGPAATAPDDPCYLLMTSGSTGPPKWVVHRHGDIATCLATYGARVLRLRPGDITWSVAALATSYGFGNGCYFPLGAGACAWLGDPDRSPAALARALAEGVNVVFGVPTWWARVARHAREGRFDAAALAGVRLAVSAGEHLPARLWHEVRDTLGLRLVNGLGSSEATNLYLSDRPGRPRAGTVGRPVPGYEVRVARSGGDPGEGELLVRGASVMSGYLGDPIASGRALEGGWLRTGDLVRREADGSYSFLGRTGERVKVGGLWVTPAQVQAELLRDPDVAYAVVIPVEDAGGLLRLGAAVSMAPGAPADALASLRERLARRLAAHEVPRAIARLDELPVLASGKPDRAAIAALVAEALPRTASLAGAR